MLATTQSYVGTVKVTFFMLCASVNYLLETTRKLFNSANFLSTIISSPRTGMKSKIIQLCISIIKGKTHTRFIAVTSSQSGRMGPSNPAMGSKYVTK